MVVMAMMVVIIVIVVMAAGLMQSFAQFLVHRRHQLDCPGNMLGKSGLPVFGHNSLPFPELFHMPFIMLYPVLQHYPQFFYIVHTISSHRNLSTDYYFSIL